MKLLDCMPCIGTRSVRPEPEKRAPPPPPPPPQQPQPPLPVLERVPAVGVQKRRRWGQGAWKPSLVVIPEDGLLCTASGKETGRDRTAPAAGAAKAAPANKKAKRKSPGVVSVMSWGYRDSERQFGASAMFAAFTPSPFPF